MIFRIIGAVFFTLLFSFYQVSPISAAEKNLSTKNEEHHSVISFVGESVHWKVLFVPGSGLANLDKELDLDVGDGAVQIFMDVVRLDDMSATLDDVRIEVEAPSGKRIGQEQPAGVRKRGETWSASAATELGLTALPADPIFPNKDEIQTRGGKGSTGKKMSRKEIRLTRENHLREIARSQNAGFVRVDESGKQGIRNLTIANPTDRGRWKIRAKGQTKEPFVIVAMAVPIEMTASERREFQRAFLDIYDTIQKDKSGIMQRGWVPSWVKRARKAAAATVSAAVEVAATAVVDLGDDIGVDEAAVFVAEAAQVAAVEIAEAAVDLSETEAAQLVAETATDAAQAVAETEAAQLVAETSVSVANAVASTYDDLTDWVGCEGCQTTIEITGMVGIILAGGGGVTLTQAVGLVALEFGKEELTDIVIGTLAEMAGGECYYEMMDEILCHLFGCGCAWPCQEGAPELEEGLVCYWNFDTDFSATFGGPGFVGQPANGVTIDTEHGYFGGAAYFERENSQFIMVGSPVMQPDQDHTYSAWYKSTVSDIVTPNRYFVLETTLTGVPSWTSAFALSYGLMESGGVDFGQFYTYMADGGYAVKSFTEATGAEWHNIVVTYDSEAEAHSIFRDGDHISTVPSGGPLSPTGGLVIGGHRYGVGRNWDGWIDEVAVWDRVLTNAEIAALLVGPIGEFLPKIDDDLVSYWNFDTDFSASFGGTAFDAQPQNGVSIDAGGKFGGSARFERENSQFIMVGSPVIQPDQDHTYSAWYRLDDPPGDDIAYPDRHFIFETYGAGPANSASYEVRAGDPELDFPNLVAFYSFDGHANDLSVNLNHPLSINSINYVAGFEGQAADFNGSSSFIDIPVNIGPSSYPEITFGAWVKTRVTSGKRAILSNDNCCYDRQIGLDDRWGEGWGWTAFSGNGEIDGVNSGSVVADEWTFVAVSYHSGSTTLFVDDQVYHLAMDNTDDGTSFSRIGKNPNYDSYFDGLIDNLFIISGPMTDEQVQSIGQNGVISLDSQSADVGRVNTYTENHQEPSATFTGACGTQWHNILVTYDADAAGAEHSIYLDGAFVTNMASSNMLHETLGLMIGSNSDHDGHFFNGWIDEVAVWGRIISNDEIQALQSSSLGGLMP